MEEFREKHVELLLAELAEVRKLNAELEQRVAECAAELQSAHEEMEAFSHSVSHDLRAPLRAIGGFSRLLLQEYRGQLPQEAQRLLKTVTSSADQMRNMIDHLLKFSRLGRQALSVETVDVSALVREVLDELLTEENVQNAEVQLGELPKCQADPALLRQVFVNLLSNAIKFSRKKEKPKIEVGYLKHGENAYFVRDNGAGFDMSYADKLFGVFQRLHDEEEFEGTGVGLSIVQRIIKRHGGKIWAEAEEGKGATFYFTLAA